MQPLKTKRSNLREFPQNEIGAPVDAARLREISRQLLEIAEAERTIYLRMQSLSHAQKLLQSARKSAAREQSALLERLAKGAKLAG